MMNRIHNAKNPYQGAAKKVLCVCSAGLLRSPTAAKLLANEPFNFNTRAAGVHDYALVPVDPVLVYWADEIICMSQEHEDVLRARFKDYLKGQKVITLNIPDNFPYGDPELVQIIKEKYKAVASC